MTLSRIAQILDDLFGIPAHRVELSDDLTDDWGLDEVELAAFDAEFWAEFGVMPTGRVRIISEYVNCVEEN